MTERRMSALVAAAAAFVVLAVLWDAFARPSGRSSAPPAVDAAPPPAAPASLAARRDSVRAPLGDTAAVSVAPGPPAAPAPAPREPSYLELVARAEMRRRIRASAGITYLNDIVAASADSMLHRWDNRIANPVRVWLRPDTSANYQPAFLDAVHAAFRRWQEAGVPIRFRLDADSAMAEVQLGWRVQFEIDRSGQTDLTWNEDGQLRTGTVTIATLDPKGRRMTPDDVRVVALHEIGHLLGLDHSPDSTDIMFPVARVRDLSARDIQTAYLLYQLAPGSLR